jgi:hypothetical protein
VGKVKLGYELWGRWLVDDNVRDAIRLYQQHSEYWLQIVSAVTSHYCYLFIVRRAGFLVGIVRTYPATRLKKDQLGLGMEER